MTNNREEQIYKAADKATYQTPPQYSELVHKSRKVMCAYEIGFIDGCVWADSYPNWISVEDELPPPHYEGANSTDFVLVYDGFDLEFGYYDFGQKNWHGEDFKEMMFDVTHWMALPQPPRKED